MRESDHDRERTSCGWLGCDAGSSVNNFIRGTEEENRSDGSYAVVGGMEGGEDADADDMEDEDDTENDDFESKVPFCEGDVENKDEIECVFVGESFDREFELLIGDVDFNVVTIFDGDDKFKFWACLGRGGDLLLVLTEPDRI